MGSTAAIMLGLKLLDAVLLISEVAPDIKARHDARKAEIEGMVERGEDPTDAVMEAMDLVIDDLRAHLHAPLAPPPDA